MSHPWWYSGDEAAEPVEASPPRDSGASQSTPSDGVDWTSLLSGAQKVVDWATDRVLAPHSEHTDPRDHPECVVCRALVVAGRFDVAIPRSWPTQSSASSEPDGAAGDDTWPAADAASVGHDIGADVITWIPIVGEGKQPRS